MRRPDCQASGIRPAPDVLLALGCRPGVPSLPEPCALLGLTHAARYTTLGGAPANRKRALETKRRRLSSSWAMCISAAAPRWLFDMGGRSQTRLESGLVNGSRAAQALVMS